MTTKELTPIDFNDLAEVQETDTVIVARNKAEMQIAHERMKSWINHLLEKANRELRTRQEFLDLCRAKRFNTKQAKLDLKNAEAGVIYYTKIKAALDAGFHIVPDVPIDLFAIRTDAKNPRKNRTQYRWDNFDQNAKALPQGEGRLVDPVPFTGRIGSFVQNPGKEDERLVPVYGATAFDGVNLPARLAVPVILEEFDRAVALEIFDEFGVCPPTKRPDPMLIGRILDGRKKRGYTERHPGLAFLIAWWLDLGDL